MDPLTPETPATPATPLPTRGLINPNKIYQTQNGGNFINSMKMADTSIPHNAWKLIVLDALVVMAAGLFGYSFARYLDGGISFWWVFGALLLWSAFAVLEGFLGKNFPRRFLIIFFETFAMLFFFYTYAWQALVITAILILICLFWGYFSVRRELRNTIEVRFFTASGKVVGKMITAAAIFIVVMYAALMNTNGNFFVSQNSFNVFFTWSEGFIHNFYPNIPLDKSFGDFAQAVAQRQLQNNPAFTSLSVTQQNSAIGESANQIAAMFSNTTGDSSSTVASSTLNEPANTAFYDYFSALMAKLHEKFGTAFVGVWGLVVFLALRSIGIAVVWVGQFVSLVLYELLLAVGFMKISEQSATKEIIEC